MAKVGRPRGSTKLNDFIIQKWTQARRLGCSIDAASNLAGIVDTTAREWLRLGGLGRKPFTDFLAADEKAIAEFEILNSGLIQKAATGGTVVARKTTKKKDGTEETEETFTRPEWTAAAWLLERRLTEQWGRKDTLLILQKAAKEAAEMDKEDALRMLGYEGPPAALPGDGEAVPEGPRRG